MFDGQFLPAIHAAQQIFGITNFELVALELAKSNINYIYCCEI